MMILMLPVLVGCTTEIENETIAKAIVYGKCHICKEDIEQAANIEGVVSARWDMKSKILIMSYDSIRTDVTSILEKVTYNGYSNEKYFTPDVVFHELRECYGYKRYSTSTSFNLRHGDSAAPMYTQRFVLHKLISAYFRLKDAFVNSDIGEAAAQAIKLHHELKVLSVDRLDRAAYNAFTKEGPQIKKMAGQIISAKSLEQQRTAFSTLSISLYRILREGADGPEIYYQKCPMYNYDKGATW